MTVFPADFDFRKPVACGLLAASLLFGAACGKPPDAPAVRQAVTVAGESGPLPVAGKANRLLNEQSAFLRKHAQDPVDWYPWGEEAFGKAKAENKLILLSIGYASCPWSQRMQEESFTDATVARFMNRHYVNILVDREERPDINNAFLHFLYWKSKQSGWPLHVWLTPRGLPVFSGVYFPVHSEGGNPSWGLTIEHVANEWAIDPDYVSSQAELTVKDYLRDYRQLWKGAGEAVQPEVLAKAYEKLTSVYDPTNGGFTGAPKFPQPHALDFLLNYASQVRGERFGRAQEAVSMVRTTLDNVLRGGMQDQLAGGIHRYSTDIYWALPQFEKMLYDQGFMVQTLVRAARMTGSAHYVEAARQTLAYTDRELSHPQGGFYCAESSSSPKEAGSSEMIEGEFYLWDKTEIDSVVGPEAVPVLEVVYGFDETGNFPIDSPAASRFRGKNLPRIVTPVKEAASRLGMAEAKVQSILDEARARLLAKRATRPRPLLDDKVLASWNGTMISAFASAGAHTGDKALTARAVRAADFVLEKLRKPDGSLVHAYLDGPSNAPGYAEDYAMIIQAMLDLYESTGGARWLKTAVELQDREIELFWDAEGGFYDGPEQRFLFHRMKSVDESTEFSPTAVSLANMIRLSNITPRPADLEKADAMLRGYGSLAFVSPGGFLRFIGGYALAANPPLQIIVAGSPDAPDREAMMAALRTSPQPRSVMLYLDGAESSALLTAAEPELASLKPESGRTTIHFARGFKVSDSFTDPGEMKTWLGQFAIPD